MRDAIQIFILKVLINLRWAYFHIHPSYIKFYVDENKTEAHFQHRKYGTLHSYFVIVEDSK